MQWNKKKSKKYHTIETVPISNRKIVERGTFDTHNTQIHDHSIPCRGHGHFNKKWQGWASFLGPNIQTKFNEVAMQLISMQEA